MNTTRPHDIRAEELAKRWRLPLNFIKDFYLERAELARLMAKASSFEEIEEKTIRDASLLAPMVATCGPAGPNVAPFMVTFLVKRKVLEETIAKMREISKKYWGKGREAIQVASKFIAETIYNPETIDPFKLITHIMSRGHTWTNIKATGKATLGILIPPDKGAYEIRARAEIIENGPVYEYANLLHDLIHVVPHGSRSHPWYPVVLFEIEEIYDNSYQVLGRRIYPSIQPAKTHLA